MFKMLGTDSRVVLHIGSHLPDKTSAIIRFKKVFNNLPQSLKDIIILENDDKTYTVTETLKLSKDLNIPMVLDIHHFNCNHEKNEDIKKLLPLILETWNNNSLNPKMHFSSPKSTKEKRTHNFYIDYVSFLKFLYLLKPLNIDIDIMLESKGKDEALFKLIRQLKYYKPLKMKGNDLIISDLE